MCNKLRKQMAVEREQLNRLLEVHRPLLEKCALSEPDRIELSALSAMLHSFYTGIENIFKRVSVELGEALPEGTGWHKELLDAMARPSPGRPALISQSLKEDLGEYLAFRHVFRQAYTFELEWQRMSALVLRCEETRRRFEGALDAFLKALLPRE